MNEQRKRDLQILALGGLQLIGFVLVVLAGYWLVRDLISYIGL